MPCHFLFEVINFRDLFFYVSPNLTMYLILFVQQGCLTALWWTKILTDCVCSKFLNTGCYGMFIQNTKCPQHPTLKFFSQKVSLRVFCGMLFKFKKYLNLGNDDDEIVWFSFDFTNLTILIYFPIISFSSVYNYVLYGT